MRFAIREAKVSDIDQIQLIRRMVKENILSNPELVTNEHCKTFITKRGKGWVAISNNIILGFAIVDLKEDNIWALFVHPNYENNGIGKRLHHTMLDWYFDKGKTKVWLSTDPDTRAEGFYKSQKWKKIGILANGEIKFEMTLDMWRNKKFVNN